MSKVNIFWYRRDLRLHDNAGLYRALKADLPVQPLFIFDKNILDELPTSDARVQFIHQTIHEMADEFEKLGSKLEVEYGEPTEVWSNILQKFEVDTVYTNRDYEPYAKERDEKVKSMLEKMGIKFKDYKDHVIFNQDEVLKDDGDPYVVFTPYSRKWYDKLNSRGEGVNSYYLKPYPTEKYFENLSKRDTQKYIPSLEAMGFESSPVEYPDKTVTQKVIKEYKEKRNFPSIDGTSRLGLHYRFGTVSVREKARKALTLSTTYVNELIWRDFYSMILDHYPHVQANSFRAQYDQIKWRNNKEEFEAWKSGKTGYPIVDAGMRELNETGYMHNRVRMITASFLTKHLLIDWRWGEAYFAEKLLDFDLASNNGGWQWAAGSGTDAAPYFRIFNPTSQMDKFDKEKKYIKHWVSEYGTDDYPDPIVDHKEARERCLSVYKEALR